MPVIRIIALCQGEADIIRSACRFLPHKAEFRLQLLAPKSEIEPEEYPFLEQIVLDSLSHQALPELSPDAITLFASITSFDAWCTAQAKSSPTMCIYKNLALLELQSASPSPHLLQQMGYTLSIISNDIVLGYLNPELTYIEYPDITCFYKDSSDRHVLVTANHQLMLGLISIDSLRWTVMHPDLHAANLLLDICSNPHQRVLHELQLLFKQLEGTKNTSYPMLDIAAIRRNRADDRSSYSFFANHYDQYMAHVDYDLWIARILRWYKLHSSRPLGKILEMACGTANVSSLLVAQGYHVDASDLSANMLAVAARKPFKPHLYQASLSDPIPGQDYDLIICLFDSINYLTKISDISLLLRNAYNALASKGLFIFDISTRLNSHENFDDICTLTRYENCTLVHRAWFDEHQMLQKSSLRYFCEEPIGYSQQHEIHTQRVYLCKDLIEAILPSPLSLKAIYSVDSDRNIYPRHVYAADDKYTRLFFVLEKE